MNTQDLVKLIESLKQCVSNLEKTLHPADTQDDDHSFLTKLLRSNNDIITVPAKKYILTKTLEIQCNDKAISFDSDAILIFKLDDKETPAIVVSGSRNDFDNGQFARETMCENQDACIIFNKMKCCNVIIKDCGNENTFRNMASIGNIDIYRASNAKILNSKLVDSTINCGNKSTVTGCQFTSAKCNVFPTDDELDKWNFGYALLKCNLALLKDSCIDQYLSYDTLYELSNEQVTAMNEWLSKVMKVKPKHYIVNVVLNVLNDSIRDDFFRVIALECDPQIGVLALMLNVKLIHTPLIYTQSEMIMEFIDVAKQYTVERKVKEIGCVDTEECLTWLLQEKLCQGIRYPETMKNAITQVKLEWVDVLFELIEISGVFSGFPVKDVGARKQWMADKGFGLCVGL